MQVIVWRNEWCGYMRDHSLLPGYLQHVGFYMCKHAVIWLLLHVFSLGPAGWEK